MIRYFAGATLPDDVAKRILEYREKSLPEHLRPTIEPHVKIAFHEGMDAYPEWEPLMEGLAAKHKPFTAKLGKPEFIGEYVLAMPVESSEITAIHNEATKAMNPPEGDGADVFFETHSLYQPYIILASGVFSWREKKKALAEARKVVEGFSNLDVRELQLYEATVYGEKYERTRTLPLGQKPQATVAGAYAAA